MLCVVNVARHGNSSINTRCICAIHCTVVLLSIVYNIAIIIGSIDHQPLVGSGVVRIDPAPFPGRRSLKAYHTRL